MVCSVCGYAMDAFEKECPRCVRLAQRQEANKNAQQTTAPELTPLPPPHWDAKDLSALEQGEHLRRREEILAEKGLRAPPHRPANGETISPLPKTNSEIASEKKAPANEPPAAKISWGSEFRLILASFMFWPAGMLIGAVFLSRPDAESKTIGGNCLVCAFLGFIAYIFLWIAYGHSLNRLLQVVE